MNQNQSGIAHLFVLIILVIGVAVGLFLLRNPQVFNPQAAVEPITFSGRGVSQDASGNWVASDLTGLQIKLISPIVKPQTTTTGTISSNQSNCNAPCEVTLQWSTNSTSPDVRKYIVYKEGDLGETISNQMSGTFTVSNLPIGTHYFNLFDNTNPSTPSLLQQAKVVVSDGATGTISLSPQVTTCNDPCVVTVIWSAQNTGSASVYKYLSYKDGDQGVLMSGSTSGSQSIQLGVGTNFINLFSGSTTGGKLLQQARVDVQGLPASGTISASQASCTYPCSVTVNWSAQNTNSASVFSYLGYKDGDQGTLMNGSRSGSQTVPLQVGINYFNLFNGQTTGGSLLGQARVDVIAATPTGTISVSPTSCTYPCSVTVSWSTQNTGSASVFSYLGYKNGDQGTLMNSNLSGSQTVNVAVGTNYFNLFNGQTTGGTHFGQARVDVTAPTAPKVAVRHFYRENPGGGLHYYSVNDRPGGWTDAGIAFYAYETQQPGTKPVNMFYYERPNGAGGIHYYSINDSPSGWTNYGPAFYAFETQQSGTVPVNQFYLESPGGGIHFYSISDTPGSPWVSYGPSFYAFNSDVQGITVNAQTAPYTTAYRIAEDPTALSSAAWQQYTQDSMSIPFQFTNQNPGIKTVFVEFKGGAGETEKAQASINYQPSQTQPTQPTGDAPVGYITSVDNGIIKGWAAVKDAQGNYSSITVPVHIYIDDVIVQDVQANKPWDAAVGNHGFEWRHPPFGKGNHVVKVAAIGLDTVGKPTNNNTWIPFTGQAAQVSGVINTGCSGLVGDVLSWCNGETSNPNYWENRQKDTKLLWNNNVKIGINNSYGGIITQLYSDDTSYNLITEHGGAAMQLSLWGYENEKGPPAVFGTSTNGTPIPACNPTKYPVNSPYDANAVAAAMQTCSKAGNQICENYPSSLGAHVSDCVNVKGCSGIPSGGPWNPVQASGINCSFDTPTNDVSYAAPIAGQPTTSWEIRRSNPYHWTKTNTFEGLDWSQKVELGDIYAKVTYNINYNGPHTTLPRQPQEIPALYASDNVNEKYYFANSGGVAAVSRTELVNRMNNKQNTYLAMPGVIEPIHGAAMGIAQEKWWGTCDAGETHCLTVAVVGPLVQEAAFHPSWPHFRGANLSPLGDFQFKPGFSGEVTVYLFPYKYDKVISGKSVRQRIQELVGNQTSQQIRTQSSSSDQGSTGSEGSIGSRIVNSVKDVVSSIPVINTFVTPQTQTPTTTTENTSAVNTPAPSAQTATPAPTTATSSLPAIAAGKQRIQAEASPTKAPISIYGQAAPTPIPSSGLTSSFKSPSPSPVIAADEAQNTDRGFFGNIISSGGNAVNIIRQTLGKIPFIGPFFSPD